MLEKKKILLAIGAEDLEKAIVNKYKDEFNFASEVATHSGGVMEKIEYHRPHALILREKLKGSAPIDQLIFDIRGSYPEMQIIFITSRTSPGDTLLRQLVNLGVYDLITGDPIKITQVIESLHNPRDFGDVKQYVNAVGGIVEDIESDGKLRYAVDSEEEEEEDIELDEDEPEKKGLFKRIFGRKKKDEDSDVVEFEVEPEPEPVIEEPVVVQPEPVSIPKPAKLKAKPKKIPITPKPEPKPAPAPKPIPTPVPAPTPAPKTRPKKSNILGNKPSSEEEYTVSSSRIITFVSPVHGLGNTHTAFNAALYLANKGNKVLYIDANSNYSTVDFTYHLGSWEKGLEIALDDIENTNGMHISSNILRIKELKAKAKSERNKTFRALRDPLPDTLDYLFYSQDYQTRTLKEDVPKKRIRELMMYLITRESYDVIIVDSEPLGSEGVDELLNVSTKVYITLSQSVAHVGLLNRQLDDMEKRVQVTNRRYIVMNRYEKVEPSVKTFEEWVNLPFITPIPESNREVIQSTHNGTPFILQTKDENVLHAFSELAKHIAK